MTTGDLTTFDDVVAKNLLGVWTCFLTKREREFYALGLIMLSKRRGRERQLLSYCIVVVVVV